MPMTANAASISTHGSDTNLLCPREAKYRPLVPHASSSWRQKPDLGPQIHHVFSRVKVLLCSQLGILN